MIGDPTTKTIEVVQLSGWIYQGEKICFPVFTLPDGSVVVVTKVDHYSNLSDLVDSLYTPDGFNYQPWPGEDPSAGELDRKHEHSPIETTASGCAQFCSCGAVRLRVPDCPGHWNEWHSCELCCPGHKPPTKSNKKDLSTPWAPHPIIIGYEQRVNPDGYLETRKIGKEKRKGENE